MGADVGLAGGASSPLMSFLFHRSIRSFVLLFLFPPSPPCLSLCFAARGQRFSLGRVFISGSASAHGRWPLPRSSDRLPCSRLPGSAFGSVMFGVSSILPLPHIIHTTLHYPQGALPLHSPLAIASIVNIKLDSSETLLPRPSRVLFPRVCPPKTIYFIQNVM